MSSYLWTVGGSLARLALSAVPSSINPWGDANRTSIAMRDQSMTDSGRTVSGWRESDEGSLSSTNMRHRQGATATGSGASTIRGSRERSDELRRSSSPPSPANSQYLSNHGRRTGPSQQSWISERYPDNDPEEIDAALTLIRTVQAEVPGSGQPDEAELILDGIMRHPCQKLQSARQALTSFQYDLANPSARDVYTATSLILDTSTALVEEIKERSQVLRNYHASQTTPDTDTATQTTPEIDTAAERDGTTTDTAAESDGTTTDRTGDDD